VKKQCRVRRKPEQGRRTVQIESITVDPRAALMELAVATGLQVLEQILEEDRAALCGARYRHDAGRTASRGGTTPSAVVLGGRKLQVRRPRVRTAGGEAVLPTWAAVSDGAPLTHRVLQQALLGVATRRYGDSLEPMGAGFKSRSYQ